MPFFIQDALFFFFFLMYYVHVQQILFSAFLLNDCKGVLLDMAKKVCLTMAERSKIIGFCMKKDYDGLKRFCEKLAIKYDVKVEDIENVE